MKAEQAQSILDRLGGSSIDEIQRFRKLAVALAISGKLGADVSGTSIDEWANEATLSSLGTKLSNLRVGAEGLPESFRDERKFVRLGAIAKIEKGKTAITKAHPGPFPLVVTGADSKPCDHHDFEGPALIIPLVSSTGHGRASINRLHYQEGQFALGTILAAVFPKNPELFSARFLFEYLSTFTEDLLVSRMTGTANVTLTVGRIADVPVPLVDPKVQGRIDELMALCDRLEEQHGTREATRDRLTTATLSRLTAPDTDEQSFRDHARFALDTLPALTARPDQIKALRQTILDLAVRGQLVEQEPADEPASALLDQISRQRELMAQSGRFKNLKQIDAIENNDALFPLPSRWALARFGDIASIKSNLVDPKGFGDLPLIAPDNIEGWSATLLPFGKVRDSGVFSSKHRFFEGSILYSKIRPNLAKVVKVDFEGLCSADMYPISSHIDRDFLVTFMITPLFVDQTVIEANRVAMPKINQHCLSNILVPIPPINEQRRIVAKVNELLALCDHLEANLQQADNKRARLLEALLAEALAPADKALEAA